MSGTGNVDLIALITKILLQGGNEGTVDMETDNGLAISAKIIITDIHRVSDKKIEKSAEAAEAATTD